MLSVEMKGSHALMFTGRMSVILDATVESDTF